MKTDKADAIWNDPRFAQGYAKSLRDRWPGEPDKPIPIWGYVEDTDDAKFWKRLFDSLEMEEFVLRIPCDEIKQGKKRLLKMIDDGQLGPHQVVFVDSDFDYILQNEKINKNKYVFQTYTYSIENHYYQSKNIFDYCSEVSEFFDDTIIFDFDKFFECYSNMIYNLFVCMICNCKLIHNRYESDSPLLHNETIEKYFYISDIIREIEIEFQKILEEIKNNGDRNCAKKIMRVLERDIILKLYNKVSPVFLCNKCNKHNRTAIKQELNKLGVYAETVYLHINGHIFEEKVIEPLTNFLIDKILKPIRLNLIPRKDRQNKIDTHLKKYIPYGKNIKHFTAAYRGIWIKQIEEDIKRFLNNPDNRKVWFSGKSVNLSVKQT